MSPDELDNLTADLSAYLDGELSPERAREVEQALECSPELRLRLEDLRDVADSLARLPRHRAPAALTAALRREAERRELLLTRDKLRAHRRINLWVRVASTAAVLALGVFVGFQLARQGPVSAPPGQPITAQPRVQEPKPGSEESFEMAAAPPAESEAPPGELPPVARPALPPSSGPIVAMHAETLKAQPNLAGTAEPEPTAAGPTAPPGTALAVARPEEAIQAAQDHSETAETNPTPPEPGSSPQSPAYTSKMREAPAGPRTDEVRTLHIQIVPVDEAQYLLACDTLADLGAPVQLAGPHEPTPRVLQYAPDLGELSFQKTARRKPETEIEWSLPAEELAPMLSDLQARLPGRVFVSVRDATWLGDLLRSASKRAGDVRRFAAGQAVPGEPVQARTFPEGVATKRKLNPNALYSARLSKPPEGGSSRESRTAGFSSEDETVQAHETSAPGKPRLSSAPARQACTAPVGQLRDLWRYVAETFTSAWRTQPQGKVILHLRLVPPPAEERPEEPTRP